MFFRTNKSIPNETKIAWKKFKSDRSALIGLFFILFISFVSFFTYFIVPDKTPNTDRQQLEIALIPSFTKVNYLKIPKDTIVKTSAIHQLLSGKPDAFHRIPIQSFSIRNDSIYYEKIIHFQSSKTISEKLAIASIPNFTEKSIDHQFYLLGTDRFGRDFFRFGKK